MISDKFNILCLLKTSLGINPNDEVSKSLILEKVKNKNVFEIYLIQYLVDMLITAPTSVKKQNDLLIKNMNNVHKFHQIYDDTIKLFQTDKEFINYKKKISRELCLSMQNSRYIVNRVIYEFAHDYINTHIFLSKENIFLNLFLMQKWLKTHEKIKILNLTTTEEFIIFSMLNGLLFEDIIKIYDITDRKEKDYVKTEIETFIPRKLQVETTTQALIKYYYFKIKKRGIK